LDVSDYLSPPQVLHKVLHIFCFSKIKFQRAFSLKLENKLYEKINNN